MLFPESTSPPRIAGTLFALPASDPTGSPSLSMANDGGRHVILALDAMLPLLITPTTPTCPQLRLGPATPTRPSNYDSAEQLRLGRSNPAPGRTWHGSEPEKQHHGLPSQPLAPRFGIPQACVKHKQPITGGSACKHECDVISGFP
jgi:hypothetical protein